MNPANERIVEIDGVRGILSVIVVTAHMFPGYLNYLAIGCMDIFFCISGLLITRIVIANGRTEGFLQTYFARRALRIWPLYYVVFLTCLGVYWVLDYLDLRHVPLGPGTVKTMFFLQYTDYYAHPGLDSGALVTLGYLPIFQHSWSVALEEQFYVVLPALFLATTTLFPRHALRIFAVLVACCALASIGARFAGLHFWTLLGRSDAFMFGALLAVFEPNIRNTERRAVWQKIFWASSFWFAGLLALCAYLKMGSPAEEESFPLVTTFELGAFLSAALGASLLGIFLSQPRSRLFMLLRSGPLAYLGEISYSTYLWHLPIVALLTPLARRYITDEAWVVAALTYLLVFAGAGLSYRWIEQTSFRLKKRVPYR